MPLKEASDGHNYPMKEKRLSSGWTNKRLAREKGVRIKPLKVGFFRKENGNITFKR